MNIEFTGEIINIETLPNSKKVYYHVFLENGTTLRCCLTKSLIESNVSLKLGQTYKFNAKIYTNTFELNGYTRHINVIRIINVHL